MIVYIIQLYTHGIVVVTGSVQCFSLFEQVSLLVLFVETPTNKTNGYS